jgi:hypothetical protein
LRRLRRRGRRDEGLEVIPHVPHQLVEHLVGEDACLVPGNPRAVAKWVATRSTRGTMSSWVMPVSISWKLIGSPSSPGGSRGPGSAPGRAQGEHRTRACVQKEGD